MKKPAFCVCVNKDADQLRGKREADQHLCFRYIDSAISLFSKSEISSLWLSSVVVQTPKTGFLTTRLVLQRQDFGFRLEELGIELRAHGFLGV